MAQPDKHASVQSTLASAKTMIYEAVNAFSGGKLDDGEKIITQVIADLERISPDLPNENSHVQETAKDITSRAFLVRTDLNEADLIVHPWRAKH
ncbi:MAG: hypothetical protein JKY27_08365 [Magnetovibrio sp.]|nr:hypothetical protein [Magnetovibrio sp.]